MTRNEERVIKKNNKLWKEIRLLYNTYIKPTKKQIGLPSTANYPYLFKGRFSELLNNRK